MSALRPWHQIKDLTKPKQLDQLLKWLAEMEREINALTPAAQSSTVVRIYLGTTTDYFELDKTTFRLSLYLNSTLKAQWNA